MRQAAAANQVETTSEVVGGRAERREQGKEGRVQRKLQSVEGGAAAAVAAAETTEASPIHRYWHVRGKWESRRSAGTAGEVTEEEVQQWWREVNSGKSRSGD